MVSNSIASTMGRVEFNGNNILTGTGINNYVCGKCNTVLLQNMRKEEVPINFAPLCIKCNTYNDANRKAAHAGVPIMLKDISETVENSIGFQYNILAVDPRIPFYSERMALSDKLNSDWVVEHFHMPGVLYQYTSFFGLTGMLKSHSIWLTDVAYMNDTSEMQHGISMINDYLKEKSKTVSDPCQELLRRVTITQSAFDSDSGYLIACFCADDDLLSQWRAYGSGGNGYNIGFSGKILSNTEGVQMRKVIYDTEKQQIFIKNAIDSICELFESKRGLKTKEELDKATILPAFAAMLSTQLKEFMFTFKHPAFAEENEWRIIRPYDTHADIDKLYFRQYNSVPVPYMELSCSNVIPNVPILPVVQVTHGPVLHPQLTKKSVSLIMRQNGYAHAEIKGSTTPLRL